MRRRWKVATGTVGVVTALAFGAVLWLTRTGAGLERMRRLTLDVIQRNIRGDVSIGRIEGNLFGRFSLIDVTIGDTPGRPFLTAKRVSADLGTRSLFSRQVDLTELEVVDPVVRLEQSQNGEWNYERLFVRDTTPGDTTAGLGDWVTIREMRVRNGRLIVERPWSPDDSPNRDLAIAEALRGGTRTRVRRAADGSLQQTMDFQGIDTRIRDLIVSHPDSEALTLRVDELAMVAAPFNPPEIHVLSLSGNVRYTDTVTITDLRVRLPGSRIHGTVTYLSEPGDALLSLQGDTIALADLRALYPPLPETGGGALHLDAAIREKSPSEYVVTDAELQVQNAQVRGAMGLVVAGDTLRFHDTDITVRDFPTTLLERLAPGVDVATPGALSGRFALEGPIGGMHVDIDGRFDPERDAAFRFFARGGAGFGGGLVARDLAVRVDGVPVSFLRTFAPGLPVGGQLGATATLNGTSRTGLAINFRLAHNERGTISQLIGTGRVVPAAGMRMDLQVRLEPLSLELAQHFAPRLDFRGDVTGTGRVRGTPRTLSARLDLVLPSGVMVVDGEIDVTQPAPEYLGIVELRGVDLNAMLPTFPTTALNGHLRVEGSGTDLATMRTRVEADLRDLVVDSTQVQHTVVSAVARGGEVTVDSLNVRTAFGTANASGTFGLVEGRSGTLRYAADIRDLAGLRRWIAVPDTTSVPPRPGVQERVTRVAQRADSARRAREAPSDELHALVAQRQTAKTRQPPAPPPKVAQVQSVARDSIAGTVKVAGELTGNVRRFSTKGTAETQGIVWGGHEAGQGRVEYAWADVRTSTSILDARVNVDSLRVSGFAFDSTQITARHRPGEGTIALNVFPGDSASYRVNADYVLRTREGELRLRDVELRLDSATWVSTRPSAIRWRERGIEIDSLEWRTQSGGGRIFVHGEMPDVDPGAITVAVDSLHLAPWATLLQSDVPLNGIASFAGRVEGTRRDPRLNGTVVLQHTQYRGVAFPDVHSRFAYAARTLQLDGTLRRPTGSLLAQLRGSLPMDLTLGEPVPNRLLDGEIAFDLSGDSIPLGPLAELREVFSAIEGRARGSFGVRGTYREPRLVGNLEANLSRVKLASTGVVYTRVNSRVRMSGETLIIDTLVAHSGGVINARGRVQLADFDRPVLGLEVTAHNARVLDNEKGEIFATSFLAVTGPLDSLGVTGDVTVTRGVVYIPDPETYDVINTGDPAVFAVIDTATARELQIPTEPGISDRISADIGLSVARGTWVRSDEANIELYGDVTVRMRPGRRQPVLTGALFTEQGDYTFYGRRFIVQRGSARFTGGPTLNPVLQIMASTEVRPSGRVPLEIRVVIGGTLEKPNVSLESEAQPTLSQSDLLAFLAFGRSSTSLLQLQGSGLEGGGQGGSSLAGNVAALATRQLAAIALGALVDEAKSDLAEATGADVVHITPADLSPELSLGSLGTVLKGTEIQLGKYINRRTFVVALVRPTLAIPGASMERDLGRSLRLRTSFETRFQPQVPTLSTGVEPRTTQVIGGLLTWRLRW